MLDQEITEWLRWKGTSAGHQVQLPTAGLVRAVCPGPCPGIFKILPGMEIPQPPWETCASVQSLSQ